MAFSLPTWDVVSVTTRTQKLPKSLVFVRTIPPLAFGQLIVVRFGPAPDTQKQLPAALSVTEIPELILNDPDGQRIGSPVLIALLYALALSVEPSGSAPHQTGFA